MDNNRENELLVDIILKKGNVDQVQFESAIEKKDFLNKFNLHEHYENAKIKAYLSANSPVDISREVYDRISKEELKNMELLSMDILKERNIKIPVLLNNEEKMAALTGRLKDDMGLNDIHIDELLKNGLGRIETSGQKVIFDLDDNENVRRILDEHNIVYQREKGQLKIDGKILAKEGFEIENTAKNKKYLDENEILYSQKAEDERKLFVPLQGKKTALLLASSVILGPVPAYAIQVVLNQSGLLDKLLDQHLINKNQKQALENGYTVKATQKVEGKDVEQYLTKDPDTGNVNKVNVRDIQIPNRIQGVDLSSRQMTDLREGKLIEFSTKDGIQMAARIDMNEPQGVKSFYKELKNDIEYLQVPNVKSPNIDKLNYIHVKGFAGIYDIYGNGHNKERDSFLESFKLNNDFQQLQGIQSKLKLSEMSGNPSVSLINQMASRMKEFKEKVFDIVLGEEQSLGVKR